MKNKLCFLMLLSLITFGNSQSLLEQLDKERQDQPTFTHSTFKGTRVGVGHSVETRKKNTLEVSFLSRYWNTPNPNSDSFFVDKMSVRIGVDYGISDRLTYGVGYASINSVLDNFLKYRLIRQKDNGKTPFSLTLLQTAAYRALDEPRLQGESFSDRLLLSTQLLIARKFSRNFSFQIAPTFTNNGGLARGVDDINQFSIGFAGRYKLKGHTSIFSEYFYVANPLNSAKTYGLFSLGVNWDLSDLLLQFKMTNNGHFSENLFITQTRRNFNFKDGNFFFGFNAIYFIQL